MTTVIWRTREQILALFGDFTMVDPGLTWTPLWHPENSDPSARAVTFDTPSRSAILAELARRM